MKKLLLILTAVLGLGTMTAYGQTDSLYTIAIQKADSAYDFKWLQAKDSPKDKIKFENAKILYNYALQIKSNETYPAKRIKEIDKALYEFKNKPLYDKLISFADSLLNSGNYKQANKYYKACDSLYSSEYLKEKITLCKEADEISNTDSAYKFIMCIQKAENLNAQYLRGLERDSDNLELLSSAKAEYKKALIIKNNSQYVENRLKEAGSDYLINYNQLNKRNK